MAEQANCARRMRWNATEIVAVRQQQQDKTLPLKRPVLSAWLIQMAAAFISCLLPCGPRPQGTARSPPRRRCRHRPYRSRLEAYAKLCFLLFQCLENAAVCASEASSFCSFAFCLLCFPCACLGSAFFMVKSCWWRVGPVLLLLLLLLCNCNFQG